MVLLFRNTPWHQQDAQEDTACENAAPWSSASEDPVHKGPAYESPVH